MILWEKSSLDDREAIFEFLYEFNPLAAEKTDAIIENKVENLNQPRIQPRSAPLVKLSCFS